jgi:large subunit ribosomal protein L15
MKLENLFGQVNKDKKRLGRGIGSKKGKTSGRGTKGQLARTGKKIRPGFEGGQLPLVQRLPKRRGFKSIKPESTTISLDRFNDLKSGTKVTVEFLVKEGIIANKKSPFKIVAGRHFSNTIELAVEEVTEGAKKQVAGAKKKPAEKTKATTK